MRPIKCVVAWAGGPRRGSAWKCLHECWSSESVYQTSPLLCTSASPKVRVIPNPFHGPGLWLSLCAIDCSAQSNNYHLPAMPAVVRRGSSLTPSLAKPPFCTKGRPRPWQSQDFWPQGLPHLPGASPGVCRDQNRSPWSWRQTAVCWGSERSWRHMQVMSAGQNCSEWGWDPSPRNEISQCPLDTPSVLTLTRHGGNPWLYLSQRGHPGPLTLC